MNILQDELVIIQDSLKGSALESDYPDIDRNIDFKTHDDYIKENAEDYILRTNNDFYEYPEYSDNQDTEEGNIQGIPEEQENLYNYDNKQYKRYPLVHKPETIKKTAEKVREEQKKNPYNKFNTENFSIQKFINNIIKVMSEICTIPTKNDNVIDYYYNIITKENNALYIIFILLVIIYLSLSFV